MCSYFHQIYTHFADSISVLFILCFVKLLLFLSSDIYMDFLLKIFNPLACCRDPATLAYAIKRSCENKAEVVSLDEKESGLRATLNLGHTFGHVSSVHPLC